MKNQIEIGNKARCTISGFKGIVISRVEYLNGCVQLCLKPRIDKDGKEQEGIYFDVDQLEYLGDGVAVTKKDIGGPSINTPKGIGLASK